MILDNKGIPYTGKCLKDNSSSTHNSHFTTVQLSGPSAFMLGDVQLTYFPRDHLQLCTFYPADLFRRDFFKALFVLIASIVSQFQKQIQDPVFGVADFAALLHLSFFILGSLS